MTRAVIKLSGDISDAIPIMGKVIEWCTYSDVTPIATFRYKSFGVIVQSHEITLNNAGDEASAVEFMTFLKVIINNADNIKDKVKTY